MSTETVSKLKQQLAQKNRELAIEASLERVRVVAMAMNKPEDMLDVCRVISKELERLGIKEIRNIQTAIVNEEKATYLNYEYFRLIKKTFVTNIAYKGHPDTNRFVRKMLRDPNGFFTKSFKGREEVKDWIKYQTQSGQFVDPQSKKSSSLNYYFYSIGTGALGISTYAPLEKDEINLFKRFRNVFQLSFQRFIDIQKAESQAREAQVEAALERVRGKALAMHKSEELHGVVTSLKKELMGLNIPNVIAATLYLEQDNGSIRVVDLTTGGFEDSSSHLKLDKTFRLEDTDPKLWVRRMFKSTDKYFVIEADEEDFKRVITWLRTVDHSEAALAKKIIRENKIKKAWLPTIRLEKGRMNIDLLQPPTPEIEQIMLKLGTGFDLAYRRFLDLQKAETQARDAQIELGLERVRARAMAMHKSHEVMEVAGTLFEELQKLGFTFGASSIIIMDKESGDAEYWIAGFSQNKFPESYPVNYFRHPYHDALLSAWKKGEKYLVYTLEGKEKKSYDDVLFSKTAYRNIPPKEKKLMKGIPSVTFSIAFTNHGALHWGPSPLTKDQSLVLQRFAQVFEQSYTRFLDLQKAEAQARESQVEASLERMRARAMSMHKTDELLNAAEHVHQELCKLGINSMNVSYAFVDKDEKYGSYYSINPVDGKILKAAFVFPHTETKVMRSILSAWQNKQPFNVIELNEKSTVNHQTYIGEHIKQQLAKNSIPFSVEDFLNVSPKKAVLYTFNFSKGYLFHIGGELLKKEQEDILLRVTRVFEQTYTRFLDLQKAEAQTREANIEVALERVRAKALAMQEPEELSDVARVLRTEMGALGIEELETASIYIHKKDSDNAECWYALKDPADASKQMVTDQFQLNLEDTWVGREMKKFYLSEEKQTSILMQGARRKEWIEYCYMHSPAFKGYYGETIPDRTYHLYKFSHGYIGAAAPGDISAESWRLLGRAASVFSLAYSRFKDLTQARNDLQRLKEEKQRAESALADLKSTQAQLIQSEKMASLGEMTAGIAHEIQNPLNFVNNFSEVSTELIAEMKEQLEKGNNDGAIELVEDVKQNLEKINLHGKRADSIVKSMLQHSRSSACQKEPTDINALVDEYLRLAFHGFRAKDQAFNTKFETNLDNSLDKINVVPQEIGRVMLNLINNAFYAVTEKRKENIAGYEPVVTVTTLKNNGRVEVRVKDNGNGMPSHVLDKIFQPFFTTKPTGQGTGLGLSLSYDIITKGHNGELKVSSREGEGSEFVVLIPAVT